MANLPGLSFNPYTGLPNQKKTPLPPFAAATSGSLGLGGTLGDTLVNNGGTPAGLLGGAPTAPGAPAPFTLPDFTSLINNDPLYKQSLTDLGASHASNVASLANAIRQGVIGYGQLPDQAALQQLGLPSDVYSALNPETAGLAQKNTDAGLSTVARLGQAYTQGRSQLLRQLASRGALQSGESGYQFGRLQTQKNQADYDAAQQLLSLFGNEFGQYNTQENTNAAAQRQAAEDAANRASMQALLSALAGMGGGGGGSAPSNPTATAPGGGSAGGYNGQTFTVGPGSPVPDPTAYRFTHPFNPNR